jgi:cytochrome c5
MLYTAAAALAALAILPALAAQTTPDEEGRDVMRAVCTRCHDLSPITGSGGFSREDWDAVIKSMIAMGANIDARQAELILDYLAKNYPPKQN